jgi:hypothetical protein
MVCPEAVCLILVCTFFSDNVGSLFISWGQTRLLADYSTVYFFLKKKTTKNGKGLLQESNTF